ncbi:MAG TPA: hypothetical protein VMM92_14865 [Thermoanaerobaculia bacterium]|nr:hypothetical protein [Thermoanaerobaculia bacterium]
MSNRRLHPREEPYRWAIEKLDEAFGQEQVRITPRNHYHVITATVFSEAGERSDDLVLRNPTEDLNKQKDPGKLLERWISDTQARFAQGKRERVAPQK